MNIQSDLVLLPLRVLIVNPLSITSQLIATKILSGSVFGHHQIIDLILLVYSNEIVKAEELKYELEICAYVCLNSIKVSSDLPCISDADVFCFISNFSNPNSLDIYNKNNDQFDNLYLIIIIASNLAKDAEKMEIISELKDKEKRKIDRTPLIVADGLVTLDILSSITKLPQELFFCFSPLTGLAKSILGDYLKVRCNEINEALVWAANDDVFHVEIKKPLLTGDIIDLNKNNCDKEIAGIKEEKSNNMDYTQFNCSWLKKEFIEKIKASASKNPYGYIYKAAEFSKFLRSIWDSKTFTDTEHGEIHSNMGVISDGSLGTVKGLPYVLPIILCKNSWKVNHSFADDHFLRQEIKRINIAVKEQHQKLIPFCKRFLQDNVINKAFIPPEDESSVSLFQKHSSSLCIKLEESDIDN